MVFVCTLVSMGRRAVRSSIRICSSAILVVCLVSCGGSAKSFRAESCAIPPSDAHELPFVPYPSSITSTQVSGSAVFSDLNVTEFCLKDFSVSPAANIRIELSTQVNFDPVLSANLSSAMLSKFRDFAVRYSIKSFWKHDSPRSAMLLVDGHRAYYADL